MALEELDTEMKVCNVRFHGQQLEVGAVGAKK